MRLKERPACETCGQPVRLMVNRFCSYACRGKHTSVLAKERTGEHNPNWRGGKASHELNDIYHDMIGRCSRPSHPRWVDYGGRGIDVCSQWRESFWSFVEDMGERPTGLTLDRIDNDGDYAPGNCQWATYHAQNKNRRRHGFENRERQPNGTWS